MSTAADFHSQIASIMEVLANAAVAEICKLVDDGYAVVQLDVSRSQKENELLRRKVKLLELQVARYRAERGRGAEAGAVRLLHRHTAGPPLQNRTRFLNRGPAAQQSADQTQTIKLDQDPDQEVVTTTKTEPAEQDEAGLLIVKVEGAADVRPAPPEAQSTRGSSHTTVSSPATPEVSGPDPAGRRHSETEARGGVTGPARLDHDLDQEQGEEPPTGGATAPLRFPAEPPPDDVQPGGREWRRGVVGPSRPDGDEEVPPQLRDGAGAAAMFDDDYGGMPSFGAPPVAMGTAASLHPHPQGLWHQDGGRGQSRPPTLPYACTFCSRRYAHQCQLRIHRRVHTGEKPYHCAQCGKSFGQFCSLKRHQMVHTGERPFPCPHCGKQFSTSTNLKVHQSVHTGEKKFHCAKCGKNFSFLSNLIRHQALHAPK